MFLNDVHELLNYCNAAKDKLAERDQKQVDFEDMSTSLQAIMLEKERILHPNKGSANMNISEFMTDKMNDHNRARNERLFRLDTKIKELEENVAKANDDNNSYSSQMIKEYDIFQRAREIELKQGLTAYADCHIDFYKKVFLFMCLLFKLRSNPLFLSLYPFRAYPFGKTFYQSWISLRID